MIDGFVGWPEDYVRKYQQAGYWQGQRVGDIIDDAAKSYPDRIALSFEGKHVTYEALGKNVNRLALHLLDMGHRPFDRLILQLPNVPETLYLYFAAVKIGLIPVMTLPAHRQAEIGYFAEFTQATSYAIPREFRGFDYVKMAQEITSKTPTLKQVLILDKDAPPGFISLTKLLEDPIEEREIDQAILEEARPDPLWPAVFQLSGGTTGIPKLIPRTHNDYTYNSSLCQILSESGPDTALLIGIPITHNFPTTFLQGVFMCGGKVVISSSPAPNVVLPLIEEEGVTIVPAVPATVISYVNDPDLRQYNLS
ncbi:MAG: AMP-binding protein, partial [Desulfobacteraceae bacterium]